MTTTIIRFVLGFGLCLVGLPLHAAVQVKPVEWEIDGKPFTGTLVYDDANAIRRPGLVMVPNWMGVGSDAIDMATRVAGHDYVVLVADMYGSEVRPSDETEALAAVKAAYADRGESVRERAGKAVDVLRSQAGKLPLDADRIGAFGFCFGGGVVLELARSGSELPGGVVSFHGNLDSYQPAEDGGVGTSILVLNGAADTSVTNEQIAGFEEEMDAAGADWQFVDFSGARHCFSQPEDADQPEDSNCRYDERAAKRAFEMMRDFFRERFAASDAG